MLDETKWTFALSQFSDFLSGLAPSPDEYEVLKYHELIDNFEKAGETELSQFKIARDRIEPATNNTDLRAHWQTRHPQKVSVAPTYFHTQVRRLIEHLKESQNFRG